MIASAIPIRKSPITIRKSPITGPHGGGISCDFYFYVWPDGHYGGCHNAETLHARTDRLKSHRQYQRLPKNERPLYVIVVRLRKYPEKVY